MNGKADKKPSRAVHFHLVSDATGETVHAIARASLARFPEVRPAEHIYALVTSEESLEEILPQILRHPGPVIYTLVSPSLERRLQSFCRAKNLPAISALSPIVAALGNYLGSKRETSLPGGQHVMDEAYFQRMEALDFAIAHDDGQMAETLDEADIILLGVSRTSKTPTCIYLAHRGIKAANVPLVPDLPLPDRLESLQTPLIVGLLASPARLAQVRQKRLAAHLDPSASSYSDPDRVQEEALFAQRLFARLGCPVVDVTHCSVEETAAAVANLLRERGERREKQEEEGGHGF